MLGREAMILLAKFSQTMAEKRDEPLCMYGADKFSNRNFGCKILLTYDPRSSTPQSPAGQGAELGYGIGYRVGRLNHMHA